MAKHEEMRMDATNTLINATELESIRSELYIRYPEARYSALIPVDSSDDEGAETVGYLQFDSIGASAIVGAGTADSPAVDGMVTKITLPVHELGNHFKYDYRELRNARMAGRPIDAIKARISATAVEQHHDDIAMLGDGTKTEIFGGMYGMVFHPNVTKISASKTFDNMTATEILAIFATLDARITSDTKGIIEGNTFALSKELIALFEGIMVPNTSDSVMERLRATYPNYSWEYHPKLQNVGKNPSTLALGTFRVLACYRRDPDVLRYKMPMPYTMYPAVQEGRSSRIETASTSAGVEVRQPLAVVIYYGC